MKQITTRIALLALGLLSTIVARADIDVTITGMIGAESTPFAPVIIGQVPTNLSLDETNVLASKTPAFTGLTSTSRTISLGFFSLNTSAGLLPAAGSFDWQSRYSLTVTAHKGKVVSFTETRYFAINYNLSVDSTALETGGTKITLSAQDSTPFSETFNFVYNGYNESLSFTDSSESDMLSKYRNAFINNNQTIKLNLALNAVLTSTPIVNDGPVITPVPEPSTYAFLGASSLMAVAGLRRFRNKQPSKA